MSTCDLQNLRKLEGYKTRRKQHSIRSSGRHQRETFAIDLVDVLDEPWSLKSRLHEELLDASIDEALDERMMAGHSQSEPSFKVYG